MLKVIIVNNVARRELTGISPNTTVRELLEDIENTDILVGSNFAVNGNFITPDEWDMTLTELGSTDIATVVAVKAADNA